MNRHEVWVTLTSMSQNQRILLSTLKSLLGQSRLPDRILIYLSEEPFLLDKGFTDRGMSDALHEYLSSHPLIEVRWTENVGPYRKLAPLLLEIREKEEKEEKDILLLTVDDDTVYHPRLIENMMKDFERYGGQACINYRGFGMDLSRGIDEISYERRLPNENSLSVTNFATGKGGVLYHPRHFSEEVYSILFDRERWSELCPTNDDIWWNFARMASGTPLYLRHDVPYMNADLTCPVNLFLHANRESNTAWMKKAGRWFSNRFPTFAALWPTGNAIVPLSTKFWCDRYRDGYSDPSTNLYGDFLPQFLTARKLSTVLDYGSGDGHQTRFFLPACPVYVGIDPSSHAIEQCKARMTRMPRRSTTFFVTMKEWMSSEWAHSTWDVTLSLNVLPFLDEDEVRVGYLAQLFSWSHLYVVICYPLSQRASRRRADMMEWITTSCPGWRLQQRAEPGFLVYKRVQPELDLIRPILRSDTTPSIEWIQLAMYVRLLHARSSQPIVVWTDDERVRDVVCAAHPLAVVDSLQRPDESVTIQLDIRIEEKITVTLVPQLTSRYDLVYATHGWNAAFESKQEKKGTVWVLPHALTSTEKVRKLLLTRRLRHNEDLDWLVGGTMMYWTCVS